MLQYARDICDSLRDEPHRWRLGGYTLDRDDGVRVWRANIPLLNMCLYAPIEARFTFAAKVMVYIAYRRWLRNMPLVGYKS